MKRKRDPYPIFTLCELKDHIDTNPDYQRPSVWPLSNKQLLIDTVFRGLDIPKFYWKEIDEDHFEVIDGQQRIRAIWEYHDNKFKLAKDTDPVDGEEIKDKYYKDLSPKMKKKFTMYQIDVVTVYDSKNEDEIREMFLRLQNGISLKSQEKRNAMGGNMRDFVINCSKHKFFVEKVGFKDLRLAHQLVTAQMILLELNDGATDIRNSNLNNMYKDQKEFNASSPEAKKVLRTLDYLNKIFKDNTPELKPHYAVTFYLLISTLMDKYVITNLEDNIFKFFLEFENYRQDEKSKSDEKDPEIMEFDDKVSHSSDSKSSLEWRHDFFITKFGVKFQDVPFKDENRNFSYEQRRSIWRRDINCKIKIKCEGKKLKFSDMDADHIIPYSKGGKTVVSNGRASCPECNRSRGAG
tara:strand:+ start:78 stop:1301 length:1224 start_codon:yes stop_codon:yes gene_type:complete